MILDTVLMAADVNANRNHRKEIRKYDAGIKLAQYNSWKIVVAALYQMRSAVGLR